MRKQFTCRANIWHALEVDEYCYMKISNTKILRTKLTRITVHEILTYIDNAQVSAGAWHKAYDVLVWAKT